jgi:hypothetical protein
MSFIHSTIVGHFDPCRLNACNRQTIRPLDIEAAGALLSEFPDHVASRIEFRDGYVECWWAHPSLGDSEAVHNYAYRLAEIQNCVAAESPAWCITYPEGAQREQAEAWKRWSEQNPPKKQESPAPPLFDPPRPGPCPYCGEPLRTAIARQCRFCKMDWHDPHHVFRRAKLTDRE